MQARKKSPFAGKTVPLNGESGGVLYTRYTDPGEVLLDSEKPINGAPIEKKERKRKIKEAPEPVDAPAFPPAPVLNFGGTEAPPAAVLPAAADMNIEKETKVRKKARWTDEQKAAAAEEKAAARKALGLPEKAPPAAEKKKKEKKQEVPVVIRKLAPEERISGPGNAEEASKIRQTLGFVPTEAVAAPAAAATGGFAFGFAGDGQPNTSDAPAAAVSSSSEDESSSDEEEEEKPKPARAAVAAAPVKEESGDDDDSSSSSSDDEEKAAPQKAAESSDDDSSSSSDSDDSSSSDDDDDEKPAPAVTNNTTTTPGATTGGNDNADSLVSPLDSEFVPRRVYVGGMPYGFSEAQVAEFWEYCGAIESLDLLTFPDTGRFRGIAFITFATEEGYTAALACDGEACEGQTVKVQKCKWSAKDRRAALMGQQDGGGHVAPAAVQTTVTHAAVPPYSVTGAPADAAPGGIDFTAPPSLRPPAPKTTGYDVAYVGNIAYEADEAAVRALFEPFGVTKVRLHTDKDTGKPKGFAHVHFKDEPSLDSAMSLDGTQLMGRRIKVGYAQPKKEAPAT